MSQEVMHSAARRAVMKIEDYLTPDRNIVVPEGHNVTSYLDRNIAELGDTCAYRFLDYDNDGKSVELTWSQLGARIRTIGARLQQVTSRGDRVAVLAPHGVDYIAGFFAAIVAGNVAVPQFAPELPGQSERLELVLADAAPAAVLTTTPGAESVNAVVRKLPRDRRPRVIAIDAIPDSVGAQFSWIAPGNDDIAYLQYTSGATRTPVGVEISHRAVGTSVLQMVLSVGLDWNIRSVSWLPLYHDMGLLMIMYPAIFGGHITLMSPVAFVRRPYRWIKELARESIHGRTFAAAPNFAFELAAQRGLPPDGEDLDMSNVAGLINGSEPVSMASIEKFTHAFAPYGLSPTVVKPSYGMAEATLLVSTIAPDACPSAIHVDREQLGAGRIAQVSPQSAEAVPLVSCGQVSPSQWAVIVDPDTGSELPDHRVGEIWLQGNNVGSGYWRREDETEHSFRNKLRATLDAGSHAKGSSDDGFWFRTGDLGVYVDGELYVTGRIKDLVIVDGRNHYPQDLEATTAEASAAVRAGFVAAFSIPGEPGERLVIVAERSVGAGRADPGPVVQAVRAAIARRHAVAVHDVKLVPAGAIPRTSSGKLARRACQAEYLAGRL